MPYYIGDVINDHRKLIARTPEAFEKSGVTVRLNTQVAELDTRRGCVHLTSGEILDYDMAVVATGSTATVPPLPGIDRAGVFTLKTLQDGIAIKSYLEINKSRSALIVGAGFIAMEMSEACVRRGMDTTVIYRGELPVKQWDPEFSTMIRDEITRNGVTFVTGHSPVAVEEGGAADLRLLTDNGAFEGDVVIFALGVKPNVRLVVEAGIILGHTGAVKVDATQKTSIDEIYSVGDCCEVFHRVSKEWVSIPLGDIANRQGRVAGRTIGGLPTVFPGVVGAQSFKIFGLDVAKTGIDEKAAEKAGYLPKSAVIWGSPTARSMGRSDTIGVKLIADGGTGRLLGAQAVGTTGVVGRINTLSVCLWSEHDLDTIGFMDFAYSPPFGGAWDPIQIAAQVLRKKL